MVKVVFFDINGVLVNKVEEGGDFEVNGKRYVIRPGLENLFNEFDKRGIRFAVWTSAFYGKANQIMLKAVGEKRRKELMFLVDRNQCTLDPDWEEGSEEINKHATIKELSRLLVSPITNEKRFLKAEDIAIVDNDPPKLRFNPKKSQIIIEDFGEDILKIFDHEFFN